MRLFIATSFPEAVTKDLNERIAALKPKLPPASWVRPETQHLTFAFLGERDESLIDEIVPDLTARLHDMQRFHATIRGAGLFPNARRPRVGWAGLDPEQPFIDIAHRVRDVLTKHGVELDRADFKPHLTLMRLRESWPPASVQMFEKALREYRSDDFVVDSVTLYSSKLNPNGAIHTPLREFALA
jgi:RNA 2',3'-cyclic 3'-phosphodiesterase